MNNLGTIISMLIIYVFACVTINCIWNNKCKELIKENVKLRKEVSYWKNPAKCWCCNNTNVHRGEKCKNCGEMV